MKRIAIAGVVVALAAGAALYAVQEAPKMPQPQQEHEWLGQLVGEWQWDAEMSMMPDQPPQKSQGTESVRAIGGFWIVGEHKGIVMNGPFTGFLTLGYDPEKKKYVGTWVDSMTSHLWTYEGTVDASGKTLTLESEGPCPMSAGKPVKFKEVMQIKSKDHRVFTSSMQGEDGKWVPAATIEYHRKG